MQHISQFDTIGWDIDGTLLNGPASYKIRDFIFKNPQKKHYLVTFRTGDLLKQTESHMASFGYKDLKIFKKILSVPENIWLNYIVVEDQNRRNKNNKLSFPHLQFMEWKGYICKMEGIPILVDDDIERTERGCIRYGIKLFDSTIL